MLRQSLLRLSATFPLAAFLAAGCSSPSSVPTALEAVLKDHPTPAAPAPVPDSPANVVRLYQWCWNNRDIDRYREIFSDDFRCACAAPDSAGNLYRADPCTREDELTNAARIFGTASSASLTFDGDLVPGRDLRDGRAWPWHQTIPIANLTLTIIKSDGSGWRGTGGALFFVVRGDSAVIPQELLDRGFKHDPNRWYIERWEDQTNTGAVAAAATPARPLPAGKLTWCQIKSLYR